MHHIRNDNLLSGGVVGRTSHQGTGRLENVLRIPLRHIPDKREVGPLTSLEPLFVAGDLISKSLAAHTGFVHDVDQNIWLTATSFQSLKQKEAIAIDRPLTLHPPVYKH